MSSLIEKPQASNTPETDKAVGKWNYKYFEVVTAFFARKLERERDEARAHRDELVNTLNDLWRRPRLCGSALWVIKTTIANVEKDK